MGKRGLQARIRPLAATDLDEIVKYLDSKSLHAGDHFLQEFIDAANELAKMPGMGAVRKTRGRLKGLRSWPLKKIGDYLVFYRRSILELKLFEFCTERGIWNVN
jgi:plasmid stabilization system protein ParE